jgi:hypothetical protein
MTRTEPLPQQRTPETLSGFQECGGKMPETIKQSLAALMVSGIDLAVNRMTIRCISIH